MGICSLVCLIIYVKFKYIRYFYFLANLSQEESKPVENKNEEVPEVTKPNNTGFDLDDLFRMDWIPGLLQVRNVLLSINNVFIWFLNVI